MYTTESHEIPSHPLPFFSSHPLSLWIVYVKTYPGTTSTSMRYHLGSVCTINGANRENPDADEENPQGSSRQDLRNALCVRLEASLVFILLFSILFSFLTPPIPWLGDFYDERPFQRANTLPKSPLEQEILNLKLWFYPKKCTLITPKMTKGRV